MLEAERDQVRARATGRGSVAAASPLLERDAELAEIGALVNDAREGAGRLMLIEGPPGIGKTRLLEETRERAGELGFAVLTARGAELERDFSFGIVRQLLEPAVAAATADERDELLAGAAHLAAPVLEHSPAPLAHSEDSSFAVLHGLYWLVGHLSARAPLVALVDDVHWSDEASVRFLAFLARRLEGTRVGVVVAARPSEPGVDDVLLSELVNEVGARAVRPSALSGKAVAELTRARLGPGSSDELCDACHQATGGNPFFTTELLDELRRGLAVSTDPSPAAVRQLGPRRISAAVLLRVGRLAKPASALARAVAILGDQVELRHAAALAGLSPQDAGRLADPLAQAGVLEPSRPLRFVHPIVRRALYEDIPVGERAVAHARAARLLADEAAGPEAIAAQLLAGEPAGEMWAVERLREAARSSLARGAPDVAARYLRRALAEPPPAEDRAEVLLELGSAGLLVGEPDAVALLTDALKLAAAPELRARIALELANQALDAGRTTEAANVLEEALEGLGDRSPDLALRLESLLLALGVTTVGARHVARGRFAAARERAAALPDGATWPLLGSLAIELAIEGGAAEEVYELADRALAGAAPQAEAARLALMATMPIAWADRLERAESGAEQVIATARASGSPYGLASGWAVRGWVRLRRGALDTAEADATASLDLDVEVGRTMLSFFALGVLISVLVERRELEAARAKLDDANVDLGDLDFVVDQFLVEAHARLLMAEGRPEAALRELRRCERFERQFSGHASIATEAWRWLAAPAHAALGETERAHRLAEDGLELARRFGSPTTMGMALRTLGLVHLSAGNAAGLDRLQQAVDVLERSPAPLEHARGLVDYGAGLRRANRRADARPLLRHGLDIAQRCGAHALGATASQELHAAGGRPPSRPRGGRDTLTASERRVAQLAAQGSSNAQIAQALFVTVKTVEMHLSNAYRKLDIASRAQLPTALTDPPAPPGA